MIKLNIEQEENVKVYDERYNSKSTISLVFMIFFSSMDETDVKKKTKKRETSIKSDENATVEQIRKRAKWANDFCVCKDLNLNDSKHTLKHKKRELTLVDLGNYLHIKESLGLQDNDKLKGNNIAGPSLVNMVEHNNSTRDAIFDENRFSLVTRTEDTDGLVVSKKVIEEVVAEQPKLELRKSKMNRTLKNVRLEFQFT
nr:zinc finger, CCHC-type [Tanacetum cinerariifolium]